MTTTSATGALGETPLARGTLATLGTSDRASAPPPNRYATIPPTMTAPAIANFAFTERASYALLDEMGGSAPQAPERLRLESLRFAPRFSIENVSAALREPTEGVERRHHADERSLVVHDGHFEHAFGCHQRHCEHDGSGLR